MQIGIVGLGRMGSNILRRLARNGHQCVGFDQNKEARAQISENNAKAVESLEELVNALSHSHQPKILWLMLPAGKITEESIDKLVPLLSAEDILIDGGVGDHSESTVLNCTGEEIEMVREGKGEVD